MGVLGGIDSQFRESAQSFVADADADIFARCGNPVKGTYRTGIVNNTEIFFRQSYQIPEPI